MRTIWYCNSCGGQRDIMEKDTDPNNKLYRCVGCTLGVCINCIDIKQGYAVLWCNECINNIKKGI